MSTFTKEYVVTSDQTALAMGSGDLEVLATPALVAMMENCSKELLKSYLTSEQTSVGAAIEVKHLAPSKVETVIKITAEIIEKTERKVLFSIQAFQQEQLIGSSSHCRVVVEKATFLKKMK
ncbi:thioesterase family protein [Enterococcus hailinensis]|uniref:thioesterase family protein n=1 Tax=Enterococcus hailinensis TaxID=3238988 RepID=UPI0038B388CE